MSIFTEHSILETRRQFFSRGKNALGYAALASLLGPAMKLWGNESATGSPRCRTSRRR